MVSARREEIHWRHEFFERKDLRLGLRILQDAGTGERIGALVHAPETDRGMLPVFTLELLPGISWYAALPSILRDLAAVGENYARVEKARFDGFNFCVGSEHPVHILLGDFMRRVMPESPFAWYMRVPDLPGFLRRVAPALENRLACSVLAGYSGELAIDFYTRDAGLLIRVEDGKLASVVNRAGEWWNGAMPAENFLQLLFGYRSVDEIEAASAEVHLRNPLRLVLQCLFPKKASFILSVC
jgi:hypothetical protein